MLDQVMSLFDIVPDFDLDIMAPNQSLEQISIKILKDVSKILDNIKPDLVLVQGDTTTTFVGALAAFYKKVPIGHVEAGLRTKNRYSPFPEEINRRMTSTLATYHFSPTQLSQNNLLEEGYIEESVYITGNTVIDSLLNMSKLIDKEQKKYNNYFKKNYSINLKLDKKFILVTGHRRESCGKGFKNICSAISEVAHSNNGIHLFFPFTKS